MLNNVDYKKIFKKWKNCKIKGCKNELKTNLDIKYCMYCKNELFGIDPNLVWLDNRKCLHKNEYRG